MSAEAEAWVFDPTEEAPEEEAFAPLKFEIINYPADTTLKGYLDQWNSKQLVIPEFQRRYVWDIKKASKLIESFLLGLPVPGVFLFKEKDSPRYQIIDGQQRILSAVRFQLGHFDEKTPFRLRSVQAPWDGKLFEELSEKDRFKLENAVLRATIIQQLNPKDNTSVYQIFERLNTGGVNLNPMEIRQSISYGPFVSLLQAMNKDKKWRRLIGQKKLDKRLRDVELILRVFALFEGFERYEKPMKEFLNMYMESKRGDDNSFDELKEKFDQAVEEVISQMGDKPFHLRGRLNYGVLDSVLVALMRNGQVPNLTEKYGALTADENYVASVTKNTSDATVLRDRIGTAVARLTA